MSNRCFILSTADSEYFAESVKAQMGLRFEAIKIDRRLFTNGERYYRLGIENDLDLIGSDVVVVGSTHNDDSLLELYRIGSALASLGVNRLVFAIPFFGYSTMERASKPGEVVTAKTNARLLSAIPQARLGNTFLLLDPHSPTLPHYFKGDCVRFSLSSDERLFSAVARVVKSKNLIGANLVIGSADLGRPKMVRNLAKQLGAGTAFVDKERKMEETRVVSIVGNVEGSDVIICDDMVRNGGTLIDAAIAYQDHGARRIFAVVNHLAFSNPDVIANICKMSPIEMLIGTNSHTMSQDPLVKKLRQVEVVNISSIMVDAINKVLA